MFNQVWQEIYEKAQGKFKDEMNNLKTRLTLPLLCNEIGVNFA